MIMVFLGYLFTFLVVGFVALWAYKKSRKIGYEEEVQDAAQHSMKKIDTMIKCAEELGDIDIESLKESRKKYEQILKEGNKL